MKISFCSFMVIIYLTSFYVDADTIKPLDFIILSWQEAKKNCDMDNKLSYDLHCKKKEKYEKKLRSKGLCIGKDDISSKIKLNKINLIKKEKLEIFIKILKNKWIPCLYGSLVKGEINNNSSPNEEGSYWLILRDDGLFDINISHLIFQHDVAYINCRGGGSDLEKVIGACFVRAEFHYLLSRVGICSSYYSAPHELKDIANIWPLRDFYFPCLYNKYLTNGL